MPSRIYTEGSLRRLPPPSGEGWQTLNVRKRVTFETAGAWLIGGSPSAVRWALGLLVGVIALVGTAIFAFYVGIYFLLWCVTVIPACLLLLLVGKTVVSPFKAVQVIKSRRR